MDNQDSDIEAWKRVHRKLTLALIQSRDNIAAELTQRRYLLEEMNRSKVLNTTTQQKPPTPGNTISSSGSGSSGTKSKKTAPVSSKKEKTEKIVPASKSKKSKPSTITVGDNVKVAEKVSPSMKIVAPPKAKTTKVKGKQSTKKDKKGMESTEVTSTTSTTNPTSSLPTSTDNSMAIGNVLGASPSNEQSNTMNVNADVINGGELLMSNLRFAGVAASAQPMGQVFYPPAATAAAVATAAQFGLYGGMTTLGNTGLGLATPEQMGLAFHLLQHMNQNNNSASRSTSDGDGNNNIRDGQGNTEWS
jgi:hypothetical protein